MLQAPRRRGATSHIRRCAGNARFLSPWASTQLCFERVINAIVPLLLKELTSLLAKLDVMPDADRMALTLTPNERFIHSSLRCAHF